MHFIYLKSKDAHINLDTVAEIRHNVPWRNGKLIAVIRFASPDSKRKNEQVTLQVDGANDQLRLMRYMEIITHMDFDLA